MPEFRLTPNPQVSYLLHGRFDISAPGGVALKDELKHIPGVKYYINDWNVKSWMIPIECVDAVNTLARRHKFEPSYVPVGRPQPPEVTLFNDLGKFSPYQKPDIERLLQGVRDHQAWLVAYAMGLGKTPVAIESVRRLAQALRHKEEQEGEVDASIPFTPFDILIICPAMAREVWLHGNGPEFKDNGFARWWPQRFERATHRGREYPVEPFSVTSTDNGPRSLQRWLAQAGEARDSGRTVVCSYGILRSLLEGVGSSTLPRPFQPRAIILDEAHYISNPKSAQSKAVFDAAEMFPDAYRIALTGTPLTNPDDLAGLHTILDWLWPDRFGTLGAFRWRYMNPEQVYSKAGDFKGHKYQGLNETYAPELRARLAAVASRLTKKDVAHLLPPFQCSLVPFDGDRRGSASDLAVSLLQQGHDHVRVACYFHETADALVKRLSVDLGRKSAVHLSQVDGRQTPEVRAATLALARSQPKSITVATISSTKVAIDLTFQSASVYAELTDKIEEILQNLGRGHRASSTRGHDVFILADETGDEQAQRLFRKATILSEVLAAGTEEQALIDTIGTLKEKGMTQEEIDDMLSMVRLGDDE